MKSVWYLRGTFLLMSLVPVAVACGRAGDTDLWTAEDVDAGERPLPSAAPPEDSEAGVDAGETADGDAAPPARKCSDDGFCHTDVPGGQTLRDVWGDAEGVAWTVSAEGNVLRWDGSAWVQSFAAGTPLHAVWGSSSTDLWVGGEAGLFHGTGASASTLVWTAVPAPGPVRSIWGASGSDVWAAVAEAATDTVGTVLHLSATPGPADGGDPGDGDGDAGVAWLVDPVSTAFPARYVKVWGTSSDDIWLGAEVGAVRTLQVIHGRREGAGQLVWRPTVPRNVLQMNGGCSVSRTEVYLLGSRDFYRGVSANDGLSFTWTANSAFTVGGLAHRAVRATATDDVWLAGDLGRLRHWDGVDWRLARLALDDVLPVIKPFYAIWGSEGGDVWIVGQGIALRKVAP
ncbi:MAG: hypothetical protein KF850_09355 [Labilithrix sp.]|nr:hypothetical protein [Labilithrix sp.]